MNFLRFLTLPNRTIKYENPQPGDFVAVKNKFLLNGKPFTIRMGELNYSRIPKIYWDQHIKKAKAMGLNTICINLMWNFHEQEQDIFDFTGKKEVAEFIYKIQSNGMFCILRPGPIDSTELVMGGLPCWLLKMKDLKVQDYSDDFFIDRIKVYLKEVGKQLAPYQIQNGGPIIMLQLENKYGTKENDVTYMEVIRKTIRQVGFDKVQLMGYDITAKSVINWRVVFDDTLETVKVTDGNDKLFDSVNYY
ncbi:MAG: beta-galactosidase [Paludibacter sp.]|nr:beta-galactosidase [Paludibacter sp.]